MYTWKQQFGLELKEVIQKNPDVGVVTNWANKIYYSDKVEKLTPELYEVIDVLSFMTKDPDFELSENELNILADRLINNEENVLDELWRLPHPRRIISFIRKQLGLELKKILQKNPDIRVIAKWADEIYYSCEKLTPDLDDIVDVFSAMTMDPSLELSENTLNILADKLINNEENILDQMGYTRPS